jgi:hypothetical protein
MQATEAPQRKTGSFPKALFFGVGTVLLVICLAVSFVWYRAISAVDEGFDALLTRETALGRHWICVDRKLAGFPFRIELSCNTITLSIPQSGENYQFGRSLAVAQIYQPDLAIVESDGPMVVVVQGMDPVAASWQLARGSIRFRGRDLPERLSFEADGITVTHGENGQPPARINRVELHALRHAETFEQDRAYDLAVMVRGLSEPALDAVLNRADVMNVSFDAMVTQVLPPARETAQERIETWRQKNGQVQIRNFQIERGDVNFQMSGSAALDAGRRPQFQFDLKVKGLDQIMRATGQKPELLGLLGGKRAAQGEMAFSLRSKDGQIFLGPLMLGKIPPLY